MKTSKLISNQTEYIAALNLAANSFYAAPGSSEFEERLFLLILIEEYEDQKMLYNYSSNWRAYSLFSMNTY